MLDDLEKLSWNVAISNLRSINIDYDLIVDLNQSELNEFNLTFKIVASSIANVTATRCFVFSQ